MDPTRQPFCGNGAAAPVRLFLIDAHDLSSTAAQYRRDVIDNNVAVGPMVAVVGHRDFAGHPAAADGWLAGLGDRQVGLFGGRQCAFIATWAVVGRVCVASHIDQGRAVTYFSIRYRAGEIAIGIDEQDDVWICRVSGEFAAELLHVCRVAGAIPSVGWFEAHGDRCRIEFVFDDNGAGWLGIADICDCDLETGTAQEDAAQWTGCSESDHLFLDFKVGAASGGICWREARIARSGGIFGWIGGIAAVTGRICRREARVARSGRVLGWIGWIAAVTGWIYWREARVARSGRVFGWIGWIGAAANAHVVKRMHAATGRCQSLDTVLETFARAQFECHVE